MPNVKKNRTVCMCYLVLHSVHAQQNGSFSLFVPAIKKAGVKSVTEPCPSFLACTSSQARPIIYSSFNMVLKEGVLMWFRLFVCFFVCLFA